MQTCAVQMCAMQTTSSCAEASSHTAAALAMQWAGHQLRTDVMRLTHLHTCANCGSSGSMLRKSALCAITMPAAPVFSTFACSRLTRFGSLSNAKTLLSPAGFEPWTTSSPASCLLRFFLLLLLLPVCSWSAAPAAAAAAAAVAACKSAAACVVLLPGAAQQSTRCHPGPGCRACAGMQLALLCSLSTTGSAKVIELKYNTKQQSRIDAALSGHCQSSVA